MVGFLPKTLHVGFGFASGYKIVRFVECCNVLLVDKPVGKLCGKGGIGV